MVGEEENSAEHQEWLELYEKLSTLLERRGTSSAFGDGDYWLLDDDHGNGEHLLYIFREEFLTTDLIYEIKALLAGCSSWKSRGCHGCDRLGQDDRAADGTCHFCNRYSRRLRETVFDGQMDKLMNVRFS